MAVAAIGIDDRAITLGARQHTCITPASASTTLVNVTDETLEYARSLAVTNRSMSARRIWGHVEERIDERFNGSHVLVVRPTKNSVMRAVKLIRNEEIAGDVIEKVKLPDYYFMSADDKRRFLNVVFQYPLPSDEIDDKLHTILGWGHPELISLLRRSQIHVFIDGTFFCVPKGFSQCIVIMIYDDDTDLYVPVMFFLVDNKKQWTYWHVIHCLFVLTEANLDPASFTTDFELALVKAISEQFKGVKQYGCSFHFKQSLRRHLQQLHIAPEKISTAMRPGMLDALRTTPKKKLRKLMSELSAKLSSEEDAESWNKFFRYVQDAWIEGPIPFDVWNVSADFNANEARLCATNNAPECFNRQLNSAFPTPRPNIFQLIEAIRNQSTMKVRERKDILERGGRRPCRD